MKTVYLVRHAKSSWDNKDLADFDRPLNERGKKDAPMMGEILRQLQILPDLLLSSPAKRAYSTARKIAKSIGYSREEIETNPQIYHGEPDTLLGILQQQDNSIQSLMLVGHNPGLTELAESLSGKSIENIPTCGIVCIEFRVEQWNRIVPEGGVLKFFDYPKKHK